MSYDDFARDVRASGIVTDPWAFGKPRFREAPIVLDAARAATLAAVAEDVAGVFDELCRIVADAPDLLDDFFQLTPFQKAMWHASAPHWHGIARADVFETDGAPVVAELNCDTPTGEPEAVILGRVAAAANPGCIDPAATLEARFVAMLEAVARAELGGLPKDAAIGIVYATEFTDDLAVVRLYKSWLESRGHQVVLGSPYNLSFDGSHARVFDTRIQLVVRHYKTDWWGERASAWTDEDVPDRDPLLAPLTALFSAMALGNLAVVNPFGAVVPQNKRAMAFLWEHIHRFCSRSQSIIERHVPVTSRLERIHEEQLFAERASWVIKSDYGAEGDEVLVGRLTPDAAWRSAIALARPGRWIAQRFFDARVDAAGEHENLGVFLVAGEAAGFYARVQAGATDVEARSVPVLVSR